jgi:hypothetical protein
MIRWIGLRKYRDKQNAPMITNDPRIDRTEVTRPAIPTISNCSSVSFILRIVSPGRNGDVAGNEAPIDSKIHSHI